MALIKQLEKKGSHTLVTFKLDDSQVSNSSQVSLLGDFNDWQNHDSVFQMKKEGTSYITSVKLENGKRYEFRYLSEGNGWFNDSSADAYVPSPYYGIDNCVVDLSEVSKKVTSQKVVSPKKKVVKKDNLKKIEGIGPKIASILTENGIATFEELSKARVITLKKILKEAGSRFSMHKPNSWPKQAKLAFEEKWDRLKKLQDKLDGGK